MILSFKTQINGKPTYFVEKILNCISLKNLSEENLSPYFLKTGSAAHRSTIKLHTIRKDKEDHWETGTPIDFVTDEDTKGFRFAPQIPVVSTQFIGIYHLENSIEVFIDDTWIYPSVVKEIALNDGFESIEDFFAYFHEDYSGKILHWTDLRY